MQLPDGTSAAIVEGLPLLMVKESDADLFANQIGLERNADQAIIAVRTIDCNGRPSPGVTLTLDRAKGLAFSYLANLVLSAEDPPQPTDERGLAGFANIALPNNVPIYNVTVEGVSPDGKRFGKLPFFIRPNQMTAGEIRPYPTEYGR